MTTPYDITKDPNFWVNNSTSQTGYNNLPYISGNYSDSLGNDYSIFSNTLSNSSEPTSYGWGDFWDDTKSAGSWLIGNKDFSPLALGLKFGNVALNYKNAKDILKFQRQQHQDQMNFARYNALADINADMANANMQLLKWAGFNPERASEYGKSFVNSFQDVINAAKDIGISSDKFSGNLAQLNELVNK